MIEITPALEKRLRDYGYEGSVDVMSIIKSIKSIFTGFTRYQKNKKYKYLALSNLPYKENVILPMGEGDNGLEAICYLYINIKKYELGDDK